MRFMRSFLTWFLPACALAAGPVPKVVRLEAGGKDYLPVLMGVPETGGMRSGLVVLAPGRAVGRHSTEGNEELLVVLEGAGPAGFAAIATGEVAPLIHMPPGQPADAVRLLRDIESVSKLYRSRGYMMVQIKPNAQFDEEKSTVRYDLNVTEGDLYKMGELEIAGLDTQAKARMLAAWTLREGQPYNADYPKKYLDDTRNLIPRGVQWAISIHETPDTKDKTVDVEIRFKQQ